MEFSFEDHAYNKVLNRFGILGESRKALFNKVLIPFIICWLPLAIISLVLGTFWTGNMDTSFITHFDTQARFLISMPILILAERLIGKRLNIVLNQFKYSGIVRKEDHGKFDDIVKRKILFLQSHWTDIVIFVLCYVHVFAVLLYESEYTSFLTWQIVMEDGEPTLNLAGKWSVLISRPFFLFLFYRWMLRFIVWGIILRQISKMDLNLFAEHPDLCGGLAFLGYGIRYFSPVAFAFSATVAGNMADFMLIEGEHIADLRAPAIGYFIFISILFVLPLLSFTTKLINAREKSVFENYDFANGMFRELRRKVAKKYDQVVAEDLKDPSYSAVADYSAVVDNVLNMKLLPFTLKDMLPLWIMTALPFLGVILLEIPVNELIKNLMTFLF